MKEVWRMLRVPIDGPVPPQGLSRVAGPLDPLNG